MHIIATKGRTIINQYKSLRTAKTYGRIHNCDHLFVVEITMSGSRPTLTILQSYSRSNTIMRFWQRD